MRKIIVSEFVSLDGVVDRPDCWSFPWSSDETGKFKFDELFAADALLLGRATYDAFAAAWPDMTDTGEFGERMNGMCKYVVSTTLKTADWNNTTIINENILETINKLKHEDEQDLLIFGSTQLVRTLLQEDLIDEYRMMIFPVVVGTGKRLFTDGSTEGSLHDKTREDVEGFMKSLELTDVTKFDSGAVVLKYGPKNA